MTGGRDELDPVGTADAALRRVRGHTRGRFLEVDDPRARSSASFGERATALVRSYKRDLDRNRSVRHEIQQELASRTYRLTEVRILDIVIWSVSAR